MLNKNVQDILGQINNFTNTILIEYPITIGVTDSQDVLVYFDISKVDDSDYSKLVENNGIGLKDKLQEFLNILNMFSENREINLKERNLFISDKERNIETSYLINTLNAVQQYKKDPLIFTSTESFESSAELLITSDDIKKIKNATNIFKNLDDLILYSNGNTLQFKLTSISKFNAKSDTFTLNKVTGTQLKEFNIRIPVEKFKMLPNSDYILKVKHKKEGNRYRLLFENKNLNGFKVLYSASVVE